MAEHALTQIKGIGLPFIINHQRNTYHASTQNWAITQNEKGYMYFANNDGVLEYEGTNWRVYPVPNASVVRSVLAVGDTIYAGAFEQFGFLAPNEKGELTWNSLHHLVPPQHAGFDEIWSIFKVGNRIIFQSFKAIFIYEDNNLYVIPARGQFNFMHKVHDNYYLVDNEQGLMKLQGDTLALVATHPALFRNELTALLPYNGGKYLLGTSNEGAFVWDGNQIYPWQAPVNEILAQHNLFTAEVLHGNYLAFGTIRNGIYITDGNGEILQHLNRSKGLQNNTILALYQDQRQNLWLGLDNGIDYIEISLPLTIFNHNFDIESTYTSIVHDDILYVGTNQGLFAAPNNELEAFGANGESFRLIPGTEGQVWSLEMVDNTLFCGHNYGCFQINGYQAREISDIRGYWSFRNLPNTTDTILAGTYSGLVRLVRNNDSWQFLDEVKGFRESSRNFFIDENSYIWVSHGYRGLFRLIPSKDFSHIEKVVLFHGSAGLPPELPYNLHNVNQKMVVSTLDGLKQYDAGSEQFVPDTLLNRLFAGKGFIDKLHQDNQGNLWYYTDEYLGLKRRLEDGSFRDITSPFARINDFLIPAFQNIFTADSRNIFIGSQYGLVHYNPYIINDYSAWENTFFREVSFYSKHDSRNFNLMYNSHYTTKTKENPLQLPYALNSVSFGYTVPVFENPEAIRFSYRLKGFDQTWSDWEAVNFKEYTNLREGQYVFEVKALNAFGIETSVASFYFEIKPPLLRSREAYISYAVVLFLIVVGNFYFVRRRILKIRQREKFRHEKRLEQREKLFKEQTELSEKEIMQLRNKSLQNEMKYKNKELANATLHLIQKNKTLTSLKTDLNKVLKSIPSDNPEKHTVANLLKKVNRDLRNEKNWELFNNYFDEVHQDFISRVKEKHPDLSPRELRLCAYLRMNLSTKEIAPLMNISIRGVEISRYRLRKKLNLEHDINLSDYFISF